MSPNELRAGNAEPERSGPSDKPVHVSTAIAEVMASLAARASSDADTDAKPIIVADSREQCPLVFSPRVRVVREALDTGDYTELSIRDLARIERKGLSDFVRCATQDRPRFKEQMRRLATFRWRMVVIEANVLDVEAGAYRSRARPWSLITTGLAIVTDLGVPVWWAGSAESAARHAEWALVRWRYLASRPEAA
jgi:ERCC4-type nuclease